METVAILPSDLQCDHLPSRLVYVQLVMLKDRLDDLKLIEVNKSMVFVLINACDTMISDMHEISRLPDSRTISAEAKASVLADVQAQLPAIVNTVLLMLA